MALVSPAAAADRSRPLGDRSLRCDVPLWVLVARIYGLYDRDEERTDHSTVDDVVGVFQLVTLGTWSSSSSRTSSISRIRIWGDSSSSGCRRRAYPVPSRGQPRHRSPPGCVHPEVIIVGWVMSRTCSPTRSRSIRSTASGSWDSSTATTRRRSGNGNSGPLIGTTEELPRLVREHGVHRVAIAFSTDSHDQTWPSSGRCRTAMSRSTSSRACSKCSDKRTTPYHRRDAARGLPSPHLSGSSRLLKRSLDLSRRTLGLVFLAPVFAAVAVLIKLDSRACLFPPGSDGGGQQTFRVFKFRTMSAMRSASRPISRT